MAYWLKMIGTSQRRIPEAWLPEHRRGELIQFESTSRSGKCPMQRGDGVLLAGSGWSRIVAAVVVEQEPEFSPAPRFGPRWPWVVLGRPVALVDEVEDGPRVADANVPRCYGSGYREITREEYQAGIQALNAQIEERAQSGQTHA